jgi:hypothetical protein
MNCTSALISFIWNEARLLAERCQPCGKVLQTTSIFARGHSQQLTKDSRQSPGRYETVTKLYARTQLILGATSELPTTRELPVFALPPVSPRSAISRYRNRWKEPLAVELPERDANRCILVRGRKPVFVPLCDAEEFLHLLRSWRRGRPVRIEWPCELADEAVEFLLAHDD